MKRTGWLLVLLAIWAGCDQDFDEINTDPTRFDRIDKGFQFAWVVNRMAAERFEQWRGNMIYNAIWAQHVAGTWETDQYNTNDETLLSAQWDRTYLDYLKNIDDVIANTEENSNRNLIARVWRVFFFQRLTDMHGDIPYFEAGQDIRVSTPKYDPQEAIYKDFVSELTNAAENLDPAAGSADNYGGQDPIYMGDIAKWRKFANSLLLRVGMRMSEADPAAAEAAVRAALAGGVFANNDDIAYVDFPSAFSGGPRNGLSLIFQENNLFNHGFSYSNELVDRLKNRNDPRIPILMANYEEDGDAIREVPTAPGDFEGRENGLETPIDLAHAQPNRNTMVAVDAPVLFLTYSEVAFLTAEAYWRGWGTGDAETAYQNGVMAACKQLALFTGDDGISDQDINTLLVQDSVAYDPNRALEQIITQKWISLVLNGYEAYAEYRRTGFPDITPSTNSSLVQGQVPGRVRYPLLESSLNTQNYTEAVERLGGSDVITERVWWDK